MINIRRGTIDDLPQVHALIHELAVYEKAPDEVTNTVEDMHGTTNDASTRTGCRACP